MSSRRPSDLRIMVLGVRAIPGVQGGVETHAEQLYPRLTRMGCAVEVLVRSPFARKERRWHDGMRITRIWAPRTSGLETFVHSVLGVCYAAISRPDVLHIHAVGPAIVTPLARALGLRVVVTHHGPDYERDKWGKVARWVLRTGEKLGMRYSHARIAISKVIADSVRARYDRDTYLIPNGSVSVQPPTETAELERYGLEPGRYFLQVSRLVPEKRQLDLIEAYRRAQVPGWKLALVGAGGGEYMRKVELAARAAGVVLTGFKNGSALQQLYAHAGTFVLPSSHEGLPIAILEALSYGLPVLASDIPANREIGLDESQYFPVGDVAALAVRLASMARTPPDPAAREARRRWVAETYDWDRIAEQTRSVYLKTLGAARRVNEERAPQT